MLKSMSMQRVPVLFLTSVTGVGRALDPSCDDDDVSRFNFLPLVKHCNPHVDDTVLFTRIPLFLKL